MMYFSPQPIKCKFKPNLILSALNTVRLAITTHAQILVVTLSVGNPHFTFKIYYKQVEYRS